jgi:large subunit ribosomal protein L22
MSTKEKKQNIASAGKSATAILRYSRIAPRKMRLVAHLVKKMHVNDAEAQLTLNTRKPSAPLLKLLKSAIANAKEKQLDPAKLVIADIRVDKGPMLKRFMPRAQGRATPIHKFTSHVTLTLQESSKLSKSRFVVEKIRKAEKGKYTDHTHEGHDHGEKEKGKLDISSEREKEQRAEKKTEAQTQEKGFTKKTFRRKSV